MSLSVRLADLPAERDAVVEVLVREIDDWVDDTKFGWLYERNPLGAPRCWVLADGDAILGVSAAFPRRLRHGERELSAWVLGDFCVSRSLRSLGPAMKLQRPLMAAVDEDVDLWYDFPSRAMLAVYRRMGVARSGEMVKWVYLLKADRAIENRVRNPVAARGLSAAGNLLLASRAALRTHKRSAELTAREGRLTAEPVRSVGLDEGLSLLRNASYLDWKFLDDPRGGNRVLESSTGGSAVCREKDETLAIVDLFGLGEPDQVAELVLALIDQARDEGLGGLSVVLSEDHPYGPVFAELGFLRRGSAPFVVHAKEGLIAESTPFFFMDGDRDL